MIQKKLFDSIFTLHKIIQLFSIGGFMKDSSAEITILTVKEVAEKLKIEPKVVKQAINCGQLKYGVHFMLFGKEPRFQWCQKLIDSIHLHCFTVSEKLNQKKSNNIKPKDTLKGTFKVGRSSFDFSCLQ